MEIPLVDEGPQPPTQSEDADWDISAIGPRYFFGAPTKLADQKRYIELLTAHLGSDEKAFQSISGTLNRITDKSIGLLQASSVFAAVATFLAQGQSVSAKYYAIAGLMLLFVAALMLMFNLGLVWRDYPPSEMGTKRFNLYVLKIVSGRAVRFTSGLWLTVLAFVVIFALLVTNVAFGGSTS